MGDMTEPSEKGTDLGRIKGAAFREFLHWYAKEYGLGRLAEAIAILPPGARTLFDGTEQHLGVLASAWYPAAAVHALLDAVVMGASREERLALAKGGARATMQATLRGIYKPLFSLFATPQIYAKFAPLLWKSYYDSGVFHVVVTPDGHSAVTRISVWPSHHRFACDLNREAATVISESMGKTLVETYRQTCVADGAPDCIFISSWQ
jgi:hypothetical protein